MFMFSFSFGSGIVGSSNIFDVIKNLELKNSAISTKKDELQKSGITDFSKDKVIILMNKEKDILLKNALTLFKSKKAHATLGIPYKETKENYIANIADNKKKRNGIAYIYRDELLLANLELDNDLILTIETINSLLESPVGDKVYESYLQGVISTIKS
ncbi:MAG: hypothetical protein U9Q66_01545, partial [Patescibacteria group bacterium]|nr:hypothetical protein [Patescibacteria group bacterium]